MIIWLEDRSITISTQRQLIKSELNINPRVFPTPHSIHEYLSGGENDAELKKDPPIFLIDVMLNGIVDLSKLGIDNASTLNGIHAGFVFADRYLRKEGFIWEQCPICFLTEREVDKDLEGDVNYLAERQQGEVALLKKYSDKESARLLNLVRKWER